MIECVLIRWSADRTTYSVLKWDANIQTANIVGLEEDLEYLVKTTPFSIPDYDPRLFLLVTTQEYVDEVSDYAPLRKWNITYTTQSRTTEQKKISVDEAEADANVSVFPINKHLKFIALALAIIDKKASGLTIGKKEQAILDKVNTKAQRVWSNHIISEAKKVDIDDSNPIDLDSDWENVDPENETTT